MDELSPKTNSYLFGHEVTERMLLADLASGRLAHGIILSGQRGIGKATLAYRFARALLSGSADMNIDAEHPVFRRIAAGSHADLLIIEPAYDEKKGELKREISVEQSREIGQFMSMTPAEGTRRVVIIDSADALTMQAANSILKILEEPPPQAVLLLVTHNAGSLLTTIRSRCRMFKLQPLSHEAFTDTMRQLLPGSDPEHLLALAELSGHSPGYAAELEEQGACEWYEELLALMSSLPAVDTGKLHAFADKVSAAGASHANWRLLTRLLLCLFERITKQAAGTPVPPILPGEAEALAKLSAMHPAHVWATKWQQCSDQFLLAERLHLDYKQMIIAFIHSIASKEGFQLGTTAA